jgi:uncharacterized protein YeaO (DUF488 family)
VGRFADLNIVGRRGIACGVLAIALVGAYAAIELGIREIESDFEAVSKVAQPRAEAALEMEINAVGVAMAVAKYLHVPDPTLRRQFETDRDDFRKFLQRYRDLADTSRHLELAARLEARRNAYIGVGEFLLDAKDRTDREIMVATESLRGIDRALDAEIEIRAAANEKGKPTAAEIALQLENGLWRIPHFLANGTRADTRIELEIGETLRNIRAQFAALARAAPRRAATVRKLGEEFEVLAPRIEAIGRAHREIGDGLHHFTAARIEIDGILDDEIQRLTSDNLGAANNAIRQEVRNSRLTVAVVLSAVFVALLALFALLSRWVAQPRN